MNMLSGQKGSKRVSLEAGGRTDSEAGSLQTACLRGSPSQHPTVPSATCLPCVPAPLWHTCFQQGVRGFPRPALVAPTQLFLPLPTSTTARPLACPPARAPGGDPGEVQALLYVQRTYVNAADANIALTPHQRGDKLLSEKPEAGPVEHLWGPAQPLAQLPEQSSLKLQAAESRRQRAGR